MNKILKYILPAAALLLSAGMTSCVNDLHVNPIDPSMQTTVDAENLFNKCYANFGLAGNGGPDGDSDVDGIDGGTSGLYRQMWNSNELTTDEAYCGWGDEGVPTYCYNTYDASHPMLRGYYYRLCVGIAYCNQYLKDFAGHDATMTAEVRFLRAFQYFLLMDAYRNIPFATAVSSEKPLQASAADVQKFIEDECKAILGETTEESATVLADAAPHRKGDARWGRIDKAAAWMLLSRLYLNSEAHTGVAQWEKAAEYAEKVIASGYKLNTVASSKEVTLKDPTSGAESTETWEFSPYQMLFMGDNAKTSAADEAIFPILSDGMRTASWGVSLFLIASTHDGDMHDLRYDEFYSDETKRSVNGVSGQAWGGNRARPELIKAFFKNVDDCPTETASYDMPFAAEDDRALFNTIGRELNNTSSNFKKGYAVAKFNNFTTDGSATADVTHPDMHVMLMRKAEAYLNAAEAYLHLGKEQQAREYVNTLRDRANAVRLDYVTLDDVLAEWSREFYFEGLRRPQLIRFGKFGGKTGYNWQWKGGEYAGRDFDAYRNVFAIPTSDLIANKNLKQNDGYK
ncbi:MAG: RagB/SusD family nutrient uptake outer membrane protein [Bacteroidales bacterium]|nr:RagB/SusD family nutrient uptake outer membrane protein [Bacteroidales bacterium]